MTWLVHHYYSLTPLGLGQTIEAYNCRIVFRCAMLIKFKIKSGFVKSDQFKWTYLDFECFEQEVNLCDYTLEIKCWSCCFIFHSVVWCLDQMWLCPFLFHYLPPDSLHTLSNVYVCVCGQQLHPHQSCLMTSLLRYAHLSQAEAKVVCVLTDESLQTRKPVQVIVLVDKNNTKKCLNQSRF